jgi:nitrogen fixation NifU-like protein
MSEAVKGMSKEEADGLFRIVHRLVTGERLEEAQRERLGKLEAFAGVRDYPARVKCASLPWHTLHAAVSNGAGSPAVVSTE